MIKAVITGTETIKNAVTKTQTELDWNTANNSKTTILTVSETYNSTVDVSIYKHVPWYFNTNTNDYQYEYLSGNTPVFYVMVYNSAKYDDATNVTLQYIIGSGYNYQGYDTQGIGTAIYNSSTRTLTWNIGYLPKGGTVILKIFTGAITSGNKTAALTNIAKITQVGTGQQDINTTNDNASCALIIDPSADIGIDQTYTTSTEIGTKYVTYTITATNNGPNNATNVTVTDKLPTGLTFNKISLDGGITWLNSDPSYNKTTGAWTIGNFNITDLPKVLMIKAVITGTETIQNAVTKTQTELDWNTANNSKTTILTNSIP